MGIEPIIGALFFSIAAALGIATIKRKTNVNPDIPIGLFWSAGMALGILFIYLAPGYPPDMSSYLFGDILTVSRGNLILILALDILVVATVVSLFQAFKAYIFDEEFSTVIGMHTLIIEYILFILIALAVVVLIHVVGIILIMALLTAPPAIARFITHDLKRVMIYAVILSIIFCLSGLWISYTLNISSGAAIVLLTSATYGLVSVIKTADTKQAHSTNKTTRSI